MPSLTWQTQRQLISFLQSVGGTHLTQPILKKSQNTLVSLNMRQSKHVCSVLCNIAYCRHFIYLLLRLPLLLSLRCRLESNFISSHLILPFFIYSTLPCPTLLLLSSTVLCPHLTSPALTCLPCTPLLCPDLTSPPSLPSTVSCRCGIISR